MKAITLHDPWGSLIPLGEKEYETRPRRLSYRGPLAVHVSKSVEFLDLAGDEPFYSALVAHNLMAHCLGHVIGIVDMMDCILMTPEFIASVTDRERAFGNWRPGRFAYKLVNPRRIEPILARGMQGLWNWEPECFVCGLPAGPGFEVLDRYIYCASCAEREGGQNQPNNSRFMRQKSSDLLPATLKKQW